MASVPHRSDTRPQIPVRVKNIICLKSGRCCAYTNCNQDLYQSGSIVGVFAHIRSGSKDGPRFDQTYPSEKLNDETNLVLLCGNHHKIVDDNPQEFTTDSLIKMKEDHERFVKQQMIRDMTNVGFPEIDSLLKHLKSSPNHSSVDWTLVDLNEKINRNQLSESTREYLKIGLLKVQEVKSFIESMDLSLPYYSDELRQVFINRYLDLKRKGFDPDSIFYHLLLSIEGDSPDFGKHAGAIAVLTYLFERCEVFEK